MRQHVPPQQLWKDFQGDLDFEYDHSEYWPALMKLCEEKHSEQKKRWVQAEKHYGESEIYLKGGNATSVYQPPSQATETIDSTEKDKETTPVAVEPEAAPSQA